MTYCLGIKIKEGLIALSDGRITSGTQLSAARKVTIMGSGPHRFFVMSSGLRSVRDKTLAYLRRDMARRREENYPTMLEAVTAFTTCLRQVSDEDKESLPVAQLSLNERFML
jgi:putative proteasome-type protease